MFNKTKQKTVKMLGTTMCALLFMCLLKTNAYAYWTQDGSGWKYLKSDGSYITSSWEWIDGDKDTLAECYYFDESGYCLLNTTTPDGYSVDENGAWVENASVQTKDLKGITGWIQANGGNVYVQNDGLIWRKRITPDNKYTDTNGWVVESEIDPVLMAEKSKNCTYIVVDKSSYHLERWENGVKTHEFVVSRSSNDGDKEREGDRKTPEGEFYVCKKIPNSNYHLALGVSYPAIEDAERGIATGLINQSEYDQIVSANLAGETPNWNTALGGYIEIHGNRQAVANSSAGCVAMSNSDIETLYSITKKDDRILIQP